MAPTRATPVVAFALFALAVLYLRPGDVLLGVGTLFALAAVTLFQWGDRLMRGRDLRFVGYATFPVIMGFVGFRMLAPTFGLAAWVSLVFGTVSTPILLYLFFVRTRQEARGREDMGRSDR
jgi:hypothetical protein